MLCNSLGPCKGKVKDVEWKKLVIAERGVDTPLRGSQSSMECS